MLSIHDVRAVAFGMTLDESVEFAEDYMTSLRLERARLKRERRYALKMAHSRGTFPLYSKGRLVVEHPRYGKG